MNFDREFNVQVQFVSEKVNKIRWRPHFMNDSHFFVTGSWSNDENTIKLWDLQDNEEESDVYPILLTQLPHKGDVTELKFLNADLFAASSSFGCLNLYRISSEHGVEPTIETSINWENLHKFPNGDLSPCTAFAVYDSDLASVGEDGRINLLSAQNRKIVRSIENADSCSLQCVVFLRHNELLTGNLQGHFKVWDLRANSSKPANSFILSRDMLSPTCLQYHPTQRHLIVAGDEEGSLTVWDLRESTYPLNVLDAHEGRVPEIQFHPDQPDQLFSCSNAGDIWHWSPKTASTITSSDNIWLAAETVKSKLDVFTLMPKLHKPVNSFDVNRNRVVCGCDNEAIYLINGVNVYN